MHVLRFARLGVVDLITDALQIAASQVSTADRRSVGILGRINSTSVKCPEAYPEEWRERHAIGWEQFKRISDRYLVLGADQDPKYAELETIGEIIETVREQRPDHRLLVLVDAFDNLVTRERGMRDELEREKYFSQKLKQYSNIYKTPIFMTSHIRKANMRRPSMEDLKGNGAKSFDAMMIMGIYNDVSREGENAEVYWLLRPSGARPRIHELVAEDRHDQCELRYRM